MAEFLVNFVRDHHSSTYYLYISSVNPNSAVF